MSGVRRRVEAVPAGCGEVKKGRVCAVCSSAGEGFTGVSQVNVVVLPLSGTFSVGCAHATGNGETCGGAAKYACLHACGFCSSPSGWGSPWRKRGTKGQMAGSILQVADKFPSISGSNTKTNLYVERSVENLSCIVHTRVQEQQNNRATYPHDLILFETSPRRPSAVVQQTAWERENSLTKPTCPSPHTSPSRFHDNASRHSQQHSFPSIVTPHHTTPQHP